MDIRKNDAIQRLQDDVAEMAKLILWQLRELDNLLGSDKQFIDKQKLEAIRETEMRIDQFEVKISEEFINIVCLHKPVASELRKIITCYRLSINLERIGDLAYKILKVLAKTKDNPTINRFRADLSHMLIIANNMVEKAILAFFNQDVDYALWTIQNDDIVDETNKRLIKKMIRIDHEKFEYSQTMSSFIYVKTIVSSIERIADEATNIAEAGIYFLKGQDVRHSGIPYLKSGKDEPGYSG